MFVDTWTTVDLKDAIEAGYFIDEVWNLDSSTNIFKAYISNFIKIKLESIPHNYPSNEAYIEDVRIRQGIDLDSEKVTPNHR